MVRTNVGGGSKSNLRKTLEEAPLMKGEKERDFPSTLPTGKKKKKKKKKRGGEKKFEIRKSWSPVGKKKKGRRLQKENASKRGDATAGRGFRTEKKVLTSIKRQLPREGGKKGFGDGGKKTLKTACLW